MKFTNTDSLVEFAKEYLPESGRKAFDVNILENTDETLVIESTYCPLLNMWQKLTDNTELIKKLCDIAMDGDRGILSCFPQFDFNLKKALPNGDGMCRVEVRRVGVNNEG